MNSESFYLIDLLLRLPRHSLFMSKARERRIWFSSSSSSLHFVLVEEVAWSVSLHCLPTAGHAVVSKTRLKVFDNKMKHIFEKCNDWSLFYSTFEKLRRKRNSKHRPSKHYERFVTLVPEPRGVFRGVSDGEVQLPFKHDHIIIVLHVTYGIIMSLKLESDGLIFQ